ncbi:MAG: hypothetical protein PHP92_03285 [Candidatus Nanoarchaeia archaeon]|nr:hypothetical protein [Candidatus Nanoarchaeia archaeon]
MKEKNLNKFSFSKKIGNFGKVNIHVDKEKGIVVAERTGSTKILGISKCAPVDTFDLNVGINLALYRFLRKLRGWCIEAEKKEIKRTVSSLDQLIKLALQKANYVPRDHSKK